MLKNYFRVVLKSHFSRHFDVIVGASHLVLGHFGRRPRLNGPVDDKPTEDVGEQSEGWLLAL